MANVNVIPKSSSWPEGLPPQHSTPIPGKTSAPIAIKSATQVVTDSLRGRTGSVGARSLGTPPPFCPFTDSFSRFSPVEFKTNVSAPIADVAAPILQPGPAPIPAYPKQNRPHHIGFLRGSGNC